ncbi:hypothetical protein PENTCL1PPCAC_28857, partial [Pristionchus entomophagus]
EMFHSFITDGLFNRSEVYKNESECIWQHYNISCKLFAEGDGNSGEATFSEDAPDLEGLRAAYELLKNEFSPQQLKEFEYVDLQITREQSFFYSTAMRSCADVQNSKYDEHSPDNIRVNALVSQMPEFSQAFGCQTGDVLFAEPDRLCYLFGALSTGKRR